MFNDIHSKRKVDFITKVTPQQVQKIVPESATMPAQEVENFQQAVLDAPEIAQKI